MLNYYLVHAILAAVWCAEVFALAYGTDFRDNLYDVVMTTAVVGFLPGLAAATLVKRSGYRGPVVLLMLGNLGVGAASVHHHDKMRAETRREMVRGASERIGELGGRIRNALFHKRLFMEVVEKKARPAELERLKGEEQKAERITTEAKKSVLGIIDEPVGIDTKIDKVVASAEGLFAIVLDDKTDRGQARDAFRRDLSEHLALTDKRLRAAEYGVRCGYFMLGVGAALVVLTGVAVLMWRRSRG